MRKFTADYVFPVHADPIKNGIVTVDDDGKILALEDGPDQTAYPNIKTETLSGIICPGFINTHCHTELSHLKDKTTPEKGLINFIKEVQTLRDIDEQAVVAAAVAADEEMYNNGIVAVGDIVNTEASLAVKQKSKLYYHTFIEVFGFTPANAQAIFDKAQMLRQKYKGMATSVTPHAPYSVSKELFKLISKMADDTPNLISIHNQETEEENKFYRYKTGAFIDLYNFFKIDINFFKPQARNSIQTVVPLLTSRHNILLVHNTFTNLKDIYFVKRFDRKINWCFCPNANLYIEGRLPKIDLFMDKGFNITLGTDSLASNSKLCLLSEMHTIQKTFTDITLTQLLQWGTLNGAKFLGINDEKGSIEVGKTPGLNLLTGLDGFTITGETKVGRLI